jgi:hypothetical protein
MDKKLLGMLGGASALALVSGGPSAAATSEANAPSLRPAQSFGELLDPIPNAVEILATEDENPAAQAPQIQLVQYYHHHHHHMYHHHHHHHHWWRRRRWWHDHWMYY